MSTRAKLQARLCFVLTTDFAVKAFLLNHLRALSDLYEITVLVNTSNHDFLKNQGIKAEVFNLTITRNINILSDIGCLIQLIKIFRQKNFLAVHSVTPKAGLLAMLAAWIVRVPLRIHTFTGQVWVNKTGVKRFLLKQFDVLTAWLANFNIVDSPSQCQFLLSEKVLNPAKAVVFGDGSISGVDLCRFKPDAATKLAVRQQLAIADDALILLFLGRLTQDKGVLDLAQAFSEIGPSNVHLIFVGPDEHNLRSQIENITNTCASFVHFVGHTNTPERYMAAADVLCLPSYREGFGSVLIEAAAVGLPSVASRIYGITDAVVENDTGLLHEPHNVDEIRTCIEILINNPILRLKLANNAKNRATKSFDSRLLTEAWVSFYKEHINT